ncbi:MAG: toll/interleukin-1 receptor domain-containing protein [Haliscomenobacter sp.]|nr:toll/interleukin-1 receptor domain-containing protein [Haliscomenobacter sp.]
MDKEKAKPIFINYRTALSAKEASWLYLMLNGRFPGEVFLDAPSVKGGTVGETAMEEAVKHCKAFLCLIPPDWAIYPIAQKNLRKSQKHSKTIYMRRKGLCAGKLK